jgi:ribonuclease P protein component
VLPARYRMTRSTDFGLTVKRGVRAVQPDLVVHSLRSVGRDAPKIGFVVSKSVGNAVVRHRVTRRLRHVALGVVDELEAGDRVVIRALPTSRDAVSTRLEHELRTALRRARSGSGTDGRNTATREGSTP